MKALVWRVVVLGLAAGVLSGALCWCGFWLSEVLSMGTSSGWAKVHLVMRSLIDGWPWRVMALGASMAIVLFAAAVCAWRSVAKRRRWPASLAATTALLALLVATLSAVWFMRVAFAYDTGVDDIQLARIEQARGALSWAFTGAGVTLALVALVFTWAVGAQSPVARRPWLSTLLFVLPCAGLGSLLWYVGSLFAWENAHPLDPKFAFANASLCCFGELAVVGEGPHEASDGPLVTLGSPTTIDGMSVSSRALYDILREKVGIARQLYPDQARLTLTVTLNARRLGTVRQLEAELTVVYYAGYHRAQLLFSQTRDMVHPVLGARYGGRNTVLNGSIALSHADCLPGDEPIELGPSSERGVHGWLRELAARYDRNSHPCFVVPPLHCASARASCVDPRDLGWRIEQHEALGKKVEGLVFERGQQRYLAAFVAAGAALELHSPEDEGAPTSFRDVREQAAAQGRRLVFAANAGMYHPDRRAVGLLVVGGEEYRRLNQARGKGNFFIQPNGVFSWARDGTPRVETADQWIEIGEYRHVSQATQSGPMLVVAGENNPWFDPKSTSRVVRNGVCVSPGPITGQQAMFVISLSRISLFEFATFFQELGCGDALYLDGNVSQVYAPPLGRTDVGVGLGPIVAVTEAN